MLKRLFFVFCCLVVAPMPGVTTKSQWPSWRGSAKCRWNLSAISLAKIRILTELWLLTESTLCLSLVSQLMVLTLVIEGHVFQQDKKRPNNVIQSRDSNMVTLTSPPSRGNQVRLTCHPSSSRSQGSWKRGLIETSITVIIVLWRSDNFLESTFVLGLFFLG